MEKWIQIEGYDNYFVSNEGNVKNTNYYGKERLMNQQIMKGYKRVCLTKDHKKKHLFVHRLVALAFIPNTDNKPEIDHIDGDPTNNKVENLRWSTRLENLQNPVYSKRQSAKRTGRHLTDEAKEKIRQFNLGKKHSEETKEKMRLAQQKRRMREKL